MVLQKRVAELENENSDLKQKLSFGDDFSSSTTTVVTTQVNEKPTAVKSNQSDLDDLLICPPVPPRESANAANQIFA